MANMKKDTTIESDDALHAWTTAPMPLSAQEELQTPASKADSNSHMKLPAHSTCHHYLEFHVQQLCEHHSANWHSNIPIGQVLTSDEAVPITDQDNHEKVGPCMISTSGEPSDIYSYPYPGFTKALANAPSFYPEEWGRNFGTSLECLSSGISPSVSAVASPSNPGARSAPYSMEVPIGSASSMYQIESVSNSMHATTAGTPCTMLLPTSLQSKLQSRLNGDIRPFNATPLLPPDPPSMLQSNAAQPYLELSGPPDLFGPLNETQLCPPQEDMNPEKPDMMPYQQDLQFDGDLYTPRWIRGHGKDREGWCGICKPGRWLVLKRSAYWYHRSFWHGVSAATGAPFCGPLETRRTARDPNVWEGLCESCNGWIALGSNQTKPTIWFKHTYRCHMKAKASRSRAKAGHRRDHSRTSIANCAPKATANNIPPLEKIEILNVLRYKDGQKTEVNLDINGIIDKGLFLADGHWVCYRRNHISCVCSYSLTPYFPGVAIGLQIEGSRTATICGFSMGLSAVVADNCQVTDLVQQTLKRDKGGMSSPEKTPLMAIEATNHHKHMFSLSGEISEMPSPETYPDGWIPSKHDGTFPLTEHKFERIHFKQATKRNRKQRAQQQYYQLVVELYANIADPINPNWVRIAYRRSAQTIVRGRSPGHYRDPDGSPSNQSPGAGGISE